MSTKLRKLLNVLSVFSLYIIPYSMIMISSD
nr:MAG TPA: hypothetical protein [Caudoviricetes sp.]